MTIVGWIWFATTALSVVSNLYYASADGYKKSPAMCAFDAVGSTLFAVWLFATLLHQ